MADYRCTIRTNYFHVKDADAFRAFMSQAYGSEDSIELWEEKDDDGNAVFGFGVSGSISGVRHADADGDDDAEESSYDEFLDGLQNHVVDGDAIIILEAGNEKLRYVIGSAAIITSNDYQYLGITELASQKAAEMLHNPHWTTKCEY